MASTGSLSGDPGDCLSVMSASLESVLVSVWQQSLIDKKKTIDLDGETYRVRQTSKSKLKQIDFRFEDRELRGLEQNPNTKSRWAKLAREGKKVMQFLEHGKYIAVVVDGKVHVYKWIIQLSGYNNEATLSNACRI
jgi:hypothetical protein